MIGFEQCARNRDGITAFQFTCRSIVRFIFLLSQQYAPDGSVGSRPGLGSRAMAAWQASWRSAMALLATLVPLHCSQASPANPPRLRELRIVVDTGAAMPMADVEHSEVVAGIHRDLGVALAARLERTPRFIVLPRKRIAQALESGTADLVCLYIPEWLRGRFQWSQPFFPADEVIVADLSVSQPLHLRELAGKPIGTVLGYSYPSLEQALGSDLVRDDAPSTEYNLRKLEAGRVHYIVTSSIYLAGRRHSGHHAMLHAPLVLNRNLLQCAVSQQATVTLPQVNRAIGHLVRDGSIQRITRQYLP
jgi:polar amino acid transport system substrate-binding protein